MRRWAIFGGLGAALAWLVLTAGPAFSQSSDTVNASVTATTACVSISISSVSFGTQSFSTTAALNNIVSSGGFVIQNCGPGSENILAKGTDASGAGGLLWSLVDPVSCPSTDRYGLRVVKGGTLTVLTTSDVLLETLAAGASSPSYAGRIIMPCTGSSGAGVLMNMQFIFTATIP